MTWCSTQGMESVKVGEIEFKISPLKLAIIYDDAITSSSGAQTAKSALKEETTSSKALVDTYDALELSEEDKELMYASAR